jgi:hypothetical protein
VSRSSRTSAADTGPGRPRWCSSDPATREGSKIDGAIAETDSVAGEAQSGKHDVAQALYPGKISAYHDASQQRLLNRASPGIVTIPTGEVGAGDLEQVGVVHADGGVAGAGFEQAR